MRTSVWWLAAAALCLGAASSARAQINLNPFAPSNSTNNSLFGGASTAMAQAAAASTATPQAGASQATFPAPGASLAGPGRLISLLPNLHSITNTHYIGYSIFPSQTDQYLAQFGYQRLR